MSMQTDVRALTATATGAMGVGRTRLRGLYYVASATAGSIVIKDGGAFGAVLLEIATPASATAANNVVVPAEGVLSTADPYIVVTNATSATVFYG